MVRDERLGERAAVPRLEDGVDLDEAFAVEVGADAVTIFARRTKSFRTSSFIRRSR